MNIENVSSICKALADENRLKIVSMLTRGEECACKILEQFEITQPTLSHHMKILEGCNLVSSRKDGKWTYYSLDCKTLGEFRDFIGGLNCGKSANKTCLCGTKNGGEND